MRVLGVSGKGCLMPICCWGVQPLQRRHHAEPYCSPWVPLRQVLREGAGNTGDLEKVSGGGEQQD